MKYHSRIFALLLLGLLGLAGMQGAWAKMPSESDWKKGRDSITKDSGMAEALKNWAKDCTDPDAFKTKEQFKKAAETIANLFEAVQTAQGKLDKAKNQNSKSVEKTRELLTTINAEMNEYNKALHNARVKIVNEIIGEVEEVIKKAQQDLVPMSEQADTWIKEIAEIASDFDTNGSTYTEEQAGKANKKLVALKKNLEDLVVTIDKHSDDLRNDKKVTTVRGKGGGGIATLYGLEGPENTKAAKRFDDNMEIFSDFEKNAAQIKSNIGNAVTDAETYIARTSVGLSEAEKQVAILAAQKKTLEKEISLAKGIISKSGGQFLRKFNPDDFGTLKEGVQTSIRSQIQILKRKVEGIDVRLQVLAKLEEKVDSMKSALMKEPTVSRPYMTLKNEIRAFRKQLNDWKTEAVEALQMWDGKVTD